MGNVFLPVVAPAANGSGAAVDFSSFGAVKTITISGTWDLLPTINIEINNDPVSTNGGWQSIATFAGSGIATVKVACKWIRATVSNYRGGVAPVIHIGGTDDGALFAALTAPAGNGVGTSVDVSALGVFKTVQVAAAFRGNVVIEVSEDGGTTWAEELSFSAGGATSGVVAADFMRVTRNGVPLVSPGLPIVNVGATDEGGGGGGGTVLTNDTLKGDGSGGSLLGNKYLVSVKDYGATGDGVTDDTVAIQTAMTAAVTLKATLWFPRPSVSYLISRQGAVSAIDYCLLVPAGLSDLVFDGDNPLITYDSRTAYAILFASGVDRLRVANLRFQGANDNNYLTNFGSAFYFLISTVDVDISACWFTQCVAVSYGSDSAFPGRFSFANNRCMNAPGGVSGPNYSVIRDNWFVNDALLGTRSHWIYIYGPADGCVIEGNVFTNCDKNAIQIRAGTARYGAKRSFVIANNNFLTCFVGVWAGSDDTTEVGGFVITGNTFINCIGATLMQGLRDSTFSGNQVEYTWEFGSTSTGTGAVECVGTPNQASHQNNSTSVSITNNVIVNRQPFFGVIDINVLPLAGDTITVGARVYTWQAGVPAAPGQVQIGGTVAISTENFRQVLRGDSTTPINKYFRDQEDAITSRFPYASAATNKIVITTRTDTGAVLATSAPARIGITAITSNFYPTYGIVVGQAFWPLIDSNTITDFQIGISVARCMSPTVINNGLDGCGIASFGSVFSTFRNNRYLLTPQREFVQQAPINWLFCSDAWPTIDEDAMVVPQNATTPEINAICPKVTVGDGKAFTYLWYGDESYDPVTPDDPNSLPFRWADGDVVIIDDGAAAIFTWTFKRTAPGALQFSTNDELLALINASVVYTAAYVPFVNYGGIVDAKTMMKITHAGGGVAGNTHRIFVTRSTTVDQKSYRTVGQILQNRFATGPTEEWGRFLGGAATLTKTAFFSPLASTAYGVQVQGTAAAAVALAPRVYEADIVPGVGGTITHTAAAGTELFNVRTGR